MNLKIPTLVVTLILVVGCLFFTPSIVKSYVERKFTGVYVEGQVSIAWGDVTLSNVRVVRNNIEGTLDTVHVSVLDGLKLQVIGGNVNLTLTKSASKDVPNETRHIANIIASDLLVKVITDKAQVTLNKVHFDDYLKPEFESFLASVYDPSGKEHLIKGMGGSYSNGTLKAHSLKVVETLPFSLPGVSEGPYEITLDLVEVDLKKSEGERNLYLKGFKMGKLLEIKELQSEYDVRSAHLKGVTINHPYLDPNTTFETLDVISSYRKISVASKGVLVSIEPNKVQGWGDCQAWAMAIPDPIATSFNDVREHFTGSLEFSLTNDPVSLNIKNTCSFTCSNQPSALKELTQTLRRGGSFTYMAYDVNNQLFNRTVGSNLENWTSYKNLSSWVPMAFTTMEDPGFFKHRGVITKALENSLKDNLKLGKFHRGGSTITMQVVKNLWLRRDKTLNRKAQEFLLALMLDECLSKEEIFELYVNIIEYGPNLYGIQSASKKYFDTDPLHLDPLQAFYLATLLPHPRTAIPPNQGGLEKTHRLLQRLEANGKIGKEELEPTSSSSSDSFGDWVATE